MMRQLLWKDYRLNGTVLLIIAIIVFGIYGIGIATQVHSSWPHMPSTVDWGDMLVSYGTVALYLTIFFAALLGGNAIAAERADRSAHFLAYLPPTKTQILASKFIVSFCAMLVVWVLILLSLRVAGWLSGQPVELSSGVTARGALDLCILTFGMGWLASASLQTAIFPIIIAISSPIALSFAIVLVCDLLGIPRFQMGPYAEHASIWTGLVAFALGTWNYFHRIEP
jgi:ABC-type transport system involved in multi-copper enzyme maturation permease subunit